MAIESMTLCSISRLFNIQRLYYCIINSIVVNLAGNKMQLKRKLPHARNLERHVLAKLEYYKDITIQGGGKICITLDFLSSKNKYTLN